MTSTKPCINYIDAILYINLEHRTDRNQHFLDEIKKIDPDLTKTHKIEAVYNKDFGALGCSQSHIKALKFFLQQPSWNTCIIFEDDFTFLKNIEEINNSVSEIIQNVPGFDVILLAYAVWDLKLSDTNNTNIKKVMSSQSASGYIVRRDYAPKLLQNFEESCKKLEEEGLQHNWCLDQYWKKLMPTDNWYTFKERIGYQYDNYSDIEKRNVAYNC